MITRSFARPQMYSSPFSTKPRSPVSSHPLIRVPAVALRLPKYPTIRWTSNEDSPRATLGQRVTAWAADLELHSRHGRTHRRDLEGAASNLASAGALQGINAQRRDP